MKSESGKCFYPESISDEKLQECPPASFPGKIEVIDTHEKMEAALPEILRQKMLGFDTETKPSFKKGRRNSVSLLQFATSDKAYLIRLNMIGLPEDIASILSDPGVTKVGVAIRDDIKELVELRHFVPAGFIDLQKIVDSLGIRDYSLKKMAAIVLGVKISKRQQVTDWNAGNLSSPQIVYAATDAWICHQIYSRLKRDNGTLT
jgi:ribonuclease D